MKTLNLLCIRPSKRSEKVWPGLTLRDPAPVPEGVRMRVTGLSPLRPHPAASRGNGSHVRVPVSYTSDMPGKHTLVLQMCSHESTTRKGLHETENLTATRHCTLPERKSPTCLAGLNVSLLLQPPVLIEMLLQKLGCCHRLRI